MKFSQALHVQLVGVKTVNSITERFSMVALDKNSILELIIRLGAVSAKNINLARTKTAKDRIKPYNRFRCCKKLWLNPTEIETNQVK